MCTREEQNYEQWEAVNEVLSRYAFHPNEAEELAKVVVALEAEVEDLKADLEVAEGRLSS